MMNSGTRSFCLDPYKNVRHSTDDPANEYEFERGDGYE